MESWVISSWLFFPVSSIFSQIQKYIQKLRRNTPLLRACWHPPKNILPLVAVTHQRLPGRSKLPLASGVTWQWLAPQTEESPVPTLCISIFHLSPSYRTQVAQILVCNGFLGQHNNRNATNKNSSASANNPALYELGRRPGGQALDRGQLGHTGSRESNHSGPFKTKTI